MFFDSPITKTRSITGGVLIVDIANNIKSLEILKIEILQNVTNLLGDILKEPNEESENEIVNDAANIITLVYLLSRRLGIDERVIMTKMKIKLQKSIDENHNLEKNFGDLTALLDSITRSS